MRRFLAWRLFRGCTRVAACRVGAAGQCRGRGCAYIPRFRGDGCRALPRAVAALRPVCNAVYPGSAQRQQCQRRVGLALADQQVAGPQRCGHGFARPGLAPASRSGLCPAARPVKSGENWHGHVVFLKSPPFEPGMHPNTFGQASTTRRVSAAGTGLRDRQRAQAGNNELLLRCAGQHGKAREWTRTSAS